MDINEHDHIVYDQVDEAEAALAALRAAIGQGQQQGEDEEGDDHMELDLSERQAIHESLQQTQSQSDIDPSLRHSGHGHTLQDAQTKAASLLDSFLSTQGGNGSGNGAGGGAEGGSALSGNDNAGSAFTLQSGLTASQIHNQSLDSNYYTENEVNDNLQVSIASLRSDISINEKALVELAGVDAGRRQEIIAQLEDNNTRMRGNLEAVSHHVRKLREGA